MRDRQRIPAAIRRAPALAAAALTSVLLAAAPASANTVTSSNWSGYVARSPIAGKSRFSSVSGSWLLPTASCSAGRETYSAVWVGLGGYSENAKGLEQIGTDADCTSDGRARYSAWLELLPGASVTLRLKVSPGDRLTASVMVAGHDATLRLRDLTSGQGISRTRRSASIDISTAEWVVEAPSGCEGAGSCQTLRLTDFGEAAFSAATATVRGHTGTIADEYWSDTELLLSQSPATSARSARPQTGTLITATPSAPDSLGAFTVTYGERAGQAPAVPALPGTGGATPP